MVSSHSAFAAAAFVAILTIIYSSIGVLHLERDFPDANITTAEDALWWVGDRYDHDRGLWRQVSGFHRWQNRGDHHHDNWRWAVRPNFNELLPWGFIYNWPFLRALDVGGALAGREGLPTVRRTAVLGVPKPAAAANHAGHVVRGRSISPCRTIRWRPGIIIMPVVLAELPDIPMHVFPPGPNAPCRPIAMNDSLFNRYLNGEHIAVCRELLELGPAVLEPRNLDDAKSVAREVVRRSLHNLNLLHHRLIDCGYAFADPDRVIVLADSNSRSHVSEFERIYGRLPILIRIWYEEISSVNFYQSKEQWHCDDLKPPDGLHGIKGLGGSATIFYLESAQECLENALRSKAEHASWTNEMIELKALNDATLEMDWFEPAQWVPYFLCGNSASNCEQKGIAVPSFCFDAVYYDDGAAQHFIEELRWGFSAGGFPLWQQLCKNPSFYIPFEYRPDFPAIVDDLTRDLFPI